MKTIETAIMEAEEAGDMALVAHLYDLAIGSDGREALHAMAPCSAAEFLAAAKARYGTAGFEITSF